MLFRQYRDMVDRISRLDKPLSLLTRSERNEVLDLSVRQEELEKHIGEHVRKGFEDLRDGLEIVSEWVKLMEEDAIKALGVEGTPEEVLALEETLMQVHSLNSQISALTLAQYPSQKEIKKTDSRQSEISLIEIRTPEPITENSLVPVIHSTIDMEESHKKEEIMTRVLEEITQTVNAAAPTYHSEVFNEPRISIQKSRPSKRKRR